MNFWAQKTVVIKVGGSLADQPVEQTEFAEDIRWLLSQGAYPVIVHGGGKAVSFWMTRLGKTPVFIEGFRYTDADTMALTEMVLSGPANAELVTLLTQHQLPAVGLSGKDGGLFEAQVIGSPSGKDLGFVGRINHVRSAILHTLFNDRFVPIISPVAADSSGQTLNINADSAAQALAVALNAEALILLTDVNQLLVDGKGLSEVSSTDLPRLLAHPDVSGGMIPKLTCCLHALEGGVQRVELVNGSNHHAVRNCLESQEPIGTRFISRSRT